MNDPESQARYIECKNTFDKSLVFLFPDKLPNNKMEFGFSAPYEGRIPGRLHLLTKISSKTEYLDMKMDFKKKSKYQSKVTDSCLFVIGIREGIVNSKCDVFHPVSIDALYDDDFKTNKINKQTDGDVFILKYEVGDFLKTSNQFSQNDLPSNWISGYSTGVTTNDKNRTIQYWFVIW
jgi:hypothetical protein